MNRSLCRSFLVLVSLLSGVPGVVLAQKKPAEAYTDPDKAGPDFKVQGEYEGTLDGLGKYALQIVARGEGKFHVAILPGGLPGPETRGQKRTVGAGKTEDGKTTITGADWTAQVADGKVTGKTGDGKEFTLTKVERKSPALGAKPPEGAIVLFDGSNVEEWNNGKMVEEKLLKAGCTTKKSFKDYKLHVEFLLPFKPAATGQSRANSGAYLQGRYEVQILDSFGLEGKNNECGGIYEKIAPSVNMCFPPLQWQTYDIEFKMARFDADGKKTSNARLTVNHNGVKVHDDVEVPGPTGFGRVEKDTPGPINFQDHGNPVYFRNVWLLPTGS